MSRLKLPSDELPSINLKLNVDGIALKPSPKLTGLAVYTGIFRIPS